MHVSLKGAVRCVSCLSETEIRLSEPDFRLTESDFPVQLRRFLRLNESDFCLSETTLTWSVTLGWYLRPS